jgi:MinD-like ATPase involved in chromosome partitioning or flagellar assembly
VINSINRGNPFVTTHPESEISQRIRELVAKVLPAVPAAAPVETAEKKPRKGLFARR